MPISRSRLHGFTLIELMITIVIMAIVLAAAMPAYTVWIQNTHIRNAAESILNGLQRARAEAVVRNTNIEFILVDRAWEVRIVGVVGEAGKIDSRPAGEMSPNIALSIFPAAAPALTTVTFSNLGTVTPNTPASDSINRIDIDSTSLSATESRDLRIVLGVGGNARMCDPNVGSSTDPRHC